MLAPLGNYGGPTQTMALLPGSPAIDRVSSTLATDQRGLGRVGLADIGAFESQGFTLTPAPGSTPQATNPTTTFARPLAVIVTARNPAEPVDGGVISFAAPPFSISGPANATAFLSAGAATISGGTASVSTASANNTAGGYTVTASAAGVASAAVFHLINGVAQAPTANSLSVNVPHDAAMSIVLTGSDHNSPPLALSYTVIAGPSHGRLSGTAPNLTYTPNAGYHGPDGFQFVVNNGLVVSGAATVALKVVAAVPTANPQSVNVPHDSAGTSITVAGTDGDDNPPEPLTYGFTLPSHGTLTIGAQGNPTGDASTEPNPGYHSPDSFTVQDQQRQDFNCSLQRLVSLNVGVGTPTAIAKTVSTTQGTPLGLTLTASDDDNPAPALTYAIVGSPEGPAHGSITGFNPSTGAFTYTPAAGFSGGDSFQFKVGNGTNTSAPATVTINVVSTQSAPAITAQPGPQAVTAGQAATFSAAASGNPAPTVRWQVSTDGGLTFTDIPGATSTTYSFTTSASQDGDEFRAVFTNAAGSALATPRR